MKKLFLFFVFISFLLLYSGCKKYPTEIDKPPIIVTPPSLELSVDGVSCTEAWIKVKKLNDTTFLPISVKINEKEFFHGFLAATDSVLYVDSLAPNTTYTAKGIVFDTVKEITITTLPTTSHNFTWQTFEFGEHSASALMDVTIIDENNIWAVGEIYINDSLGNPDSKRYNAVHWDGNKWEIKRIPYDYFGTNYYHPIHSVFAFGANDVWFCGNGIIHWNGSNFLPISISTDVWGSYQMNKIWGSSSNDLYAVGNTGNIAHYNGKTWQKVESQTTLNIYDIWGDYNKRTQEWEILAVASNFGTGYEKEILHINLNEVTKIPPSPQMWPLLTTWFVSNKQYYVCGSGIYQKTFLSEKLWGNEARDITTYSTTSIRGNEVNDVIGVGAYGDVVHYNGVNWKNNYSEPRLGSGSYSNVKIQGNLVVAVGSNNRNAVILIGKR